MNPGNSRILGLKGQRSRGTKKQCRRGCLHSCECWLLLVATTNLRVQHPPHFPHTVEGETERYLAMSDVLLWHILGAILAVTRRLRGR